MWKTNVLIWGKQSNIWNMKHSQNLDLIYFSPGCEPNLKALYSFD